MTIFKSAALVVAACLLFAAWGAQAAKFPARLFLSADGLALSSFPSSNTLKEKIKVTRTQRSGNVAWTAVSNQPWLTATSSGETGGSLTVQADPNQVKQDRSYLATVTISTTGGDFTDTETLYVGFYVGSKDPVTPLTLELNAITIAANPVLPVVYVSPGDNTVEAYNVYSGKLKATWQTNATNIGAIEVSSNGQSVFVSDVSKNKQIVALNAKNGKQTGTYDIGYSLAYPHNMVYARPFGQPALYLSGGPILELPKGQILANGLINYILAVTPNGQYVYAVEPNTSGVDLSNYSVAIDGSGLSITPIKSVFLNSANCRYMVVSHDGAHGYPACAAPYKFDVYDGQTLHKVQTLAAKPYPNNIAVDENDNVIGGLDSEYQDFDIYVYDQNANQIGKLAPATQMGSALMRVSGDGTRVAAIAVNY